MDINDREIIIGWSDPLGFHKCLDRTLVKVHQAPYTDRPDTTNENALDYSLGDFVPLLNLPAKAVISHASPN